MIIRELKSREVFSKVLVFALVFRDVESQITAFEPFFLRSKAEKVFV